MAITEETKLRRLVVTFGERDAPAAYEFEGVKFLRNEDGTDAAPPQTVRIPATQDEAAQYIETANLALLQNIEDLNVRIREQKAEADKTIADRDGRLGIAAKLHETLTAQLERANAKLARVEQADAQYDAQIKPLFAPAEPTKQ